MHTTMRIAAIAALSIWLTACTYNGVVKKDLYRPAESGQQKLPVKIALVVDPKVKEQKFDLSQGVYTWHVVVDAYDALNQTLQTELANIFEDVKVVQESGKAERADLVASVGLDITGMGGGGGGFGGAQGAGLDARLEVLFKDAKSKVLVAKLNKSTGLSPNTMNGTIFTCHMLTFLSLGLFAPIGIPCMTNSAGEEAMDAVHQKLPSLIKGLASDIESDGRLVAYARGGADPMFGGVVAARPKPAIPASDVDKVPEGQTAARKNAYAIVVGIEQYRQKLPKADFAAHDAQVVNDYLIKTLGLQEENVVLITDDHAGRTDLEKYVEKWLPNRVEKGDSVFVYFSGHGAPNPKTGEAYLVPYDGDPAYIDTTGYPLKRLYEQLATLPAKEVIVMLDSCFSGAGGRSVIAKGMRPMGLSVETPVLAKGKTVVLAASSGDQVSSTYDAKGHGLFTYFMLKGLQGEADQNKDGAVDLQEVFDYIKPQVERVARREYNNEQIPQLLGNRDLLTKGVPLVGRTR
jgi:hypothetical protein